MVKGLFLRGPVGMEWLRRAGALPGKALLVGVELWHLAGLTRSAVVKLNLSTFEQRDVSRYAAARGLSALERAGLVRCRRLPGRTPEVEVLDIAAEREVLP